MLNKKAPARGGRPSKLSPERQSIIVEALAQGSSLRAAARQASISHRTVFRWKARGTREASGKYYAFVTMIGQVTSSYPSHSTASEHGDDVAATLLQMWRALSGDS